MALNWNPVDLNMIGATYFKQVTDSDGDTAVDFRRRAELLNSDGEVINVAAEYSEVLKVSELPGDLVSALQLINNQLEIRCKAKYEIV